MSNQINETEHLISAYIQSHPNLPQVWDVDKAVNELKELLGDVGMFQKINEFIESKKSAFVISEFDINQTELTGKVFLTYQLADELKVLLSAVRAKKIDS